MTEPQATPEQELLPPVEVEDNDETLSIESAEEEDWDDLEDQLYELWLASQGCEHCAGCAYCEESSAFEGGTDT